MEQAGLEALEAIGVEGPVEAVDWGAEGLEERQVFAVGCNADCNWDRDFAWTEGEVEVVVVDAAMAGDYRLVL